MLNDYEHAEQNARGWVESIRELIDARSDLDDGAETVTIDHYEYTDRDEVEQRITESALSVEVRSGWHVAGATDGTEKPAEYRVVLTFGGPSLDLRGTLSEHGEAVDARLMMADAGAPFIEVRIFDQTERAHLLAFAQTFYYGG